MWNLWTLTRDLHLDYCNRFRCTVKNMTNVKMGAGDEDDADGGKVRAYHYPSDYVSGGFQLQSLQFSF